MLRLEGVCKSFGRVRALDRLTLRVEPGEVLGVLGPNGAGKTTTISVAVGLIRPDAGTVLLEGVGPPHDRRARAQIGLAPQSLAIYDELTASENLKLLGALYGLRRDERARRATELLEIVGLADRAGDRVRGFSGGMKRRLNVACAMVHRPRLVLLDEPTAGVDPQSRNALFDIVRTLRSESITIVYTTHYMEEAQRLCDRVAIIDRGRVLALDTVDALIQRHTRPADPFHRIADLPNAQPPTIPVRTGSDLESVFLELTGRSLRD
ncbi:MAG: ABC transporter ATP-binding protein [Phycisphaerales bacterium]